MKRRMGRPPLPEGERRGVSMHIRMTQTQYDAIRRDAERQGLTMTDLLLAPWKEKG